MKKTILFLVFTVLSLTMSATHIEYYPALVREGVKWVNEKVIVNHGDTTSYYYTYEFSGYDTLTNIPGEINQACYYYLGEDLDIECDSLIAGMRNGYKEATCYRNNAYDDAMLNDRLIFQTLFYLDGGTRILYRFGEYRDPRDGRLDNWIRIYHLGCQYTWSENMSEERVLTEENFIMVDPIEIDGMSCKRSAYIDELGEPICYVVESIGFDSYDMGDLLTPFTRKPDPDADYQEWCGLSHVVKDGKIIYKGMRYRHGAFNGIDEVVADKSPRRSQDENYYNLMGQPVGKDVPTAPGIYIHNGKKIIVR